MGLRINFHNKEPRTHAELPRGYRDLVMNRTLEQDTELACRNEIDCDEPGAEQPDR